MQWPLKAPYLEYCQPEVCKLRVVCTMPTTPCVSCIVFFIGRPAGPKVSRRNSRTLSGVQFHRKCPHEAKPLHEGVHVLEDCVVFSVLRRSSSKSLRLELWDMPDFALRYLQHCSILQPFTRNLRLRAFGPWRRSDHDSKTRPARPAAWT